VNEDAPGVLVLLFALAVVLYATARLVAGPPGSPAAPTVMSPEAFVVPRDGIGPTPALADGDR
jgi:hypothetical protein